MSNILFNVIDISVNSENSNFNENATIYNSSDSHVTDGNEWQWMFFLNCVL